MTLLAKIRAQRAAVANRAIGLSPDLVRILALPRRPPVPFAPPGFSDTLKKPGCTMELNPLQAWALWELSQCGGVIGALPAGAGKTGLGFLAGTVLRSPCTIFLVPAATRGQVLNWHYPQWRDNWQVPELGTALHIVGDISQARFMGLLKELRPRLVVVDEAHQYSHYTAARTKRLREHFREFPDTAYLPLSGTFITKTIAEIRHHVLYALRGKAPYPLDSFTAGRWADALDPCPYPVPPGELARLCGPDETPRQAFRRRFVETPGVISVLEHPLPFSLVLNSRHVALPKPMAAALAACRSTWCTPDNEELCDALQLSRVMRQLAQGFFYRLTWPDKEPEPLRREWLEARAGWNREVRQWLAHTARPGLDSAALLEQAAITGQRPSPRYDRWRAIRREAKPTTEPVWIDTYLVDDAIAWGKEHRGIIWTEYDAVAEELVRRTGWAFAGPGDAGEAVLSDLLARRPALNAAPLIASRPARGAFGTDGLQLCYSTQLVMLPSSNPKTWEQLLARLHRQKQTADEVHCDIYLHTPEAREAFKKATKDARTFIEEATPASRQKLTYATRTF